MVGVGEVEKMRAVLAAVVLVVSMAPGLARADGKLLRVPTLIPEKSLPFKFSQEAMAHHAAGVAQLKCELSDSGKPHGCKVLSGVAHVKDQELTDFAEGLTFSPAINKDGVAVALTDFRFPVRVVSPLVPQMPSLRF
ncbi:MAG: hypothetical protein JST54_14910 [Deltaproteobacteria bacterium]|nr:hypothetical protein [Deltaproteobacteria bacterium]